MKKILFGLLLVSLLLAGCGTPAMSENYAPMAGGGASQAYDYEEAAPAAPAESYQDGYDANVSAVPAQKRMVIENADMSIVVVDPEAKMQAVAAMAERMGGFVVSSNLFETYLSDGGTAPEGSMTVRVPAEKLKEALAEIKEGIVELKTETRSGQDVTQEYTDLSSRLKNLESTERQLNTILEDADKTEDVMLVFNQLTQIREQIELIKGQMQYYEQSAALSAISIRLIAEETVKPIEIGGWKPEGVVRDAVQTLVDFLKGFFEFVVWLVIVFLPAAILIILSVGSILFVLWRFVRWLWRLFFKGKAKPVAPMAPAALAAQSTESEPEE
ncbi:MAG: DUF4349 domain-containing protein [Anaerolineae bacterium]|nr:DUF4349 domain-containing protein [Anaerolineae bacterium]